MRDRCRLFRRARLRKLLARVSILFTDNTFTVADFGVTLVIMYTIIEKSINLSELSIAYTQTGDPQGRVLFCVHGLLSNGRDYDALAQAMAARGYNVICLDLPGRGRSGWFADKAQYMLPHYFPYVSGLIAQVTGGKPYDYFGVSLGGMIGMGLANIEGLTPDRLIFVDIGAEIPAAGLDAVAGLAKTNPNFKTREEAIAFLKMRCDAWGITQEDTWVHLSAHNIVQDGDGWRMHYDPAIGAALAGKNETVAFWEVWAGVKQSVLLIRGRKSVLLPESVAQKMKATYTGAKFEEIVFNDCGHVPNLMEKEQIGRVAGWF